jgi:hypothetical protein
VLHGRTEGVTSARWFPLSQNQTHDAFEGMQGDEVAEEAWTEEGGQATEILVQDMFRRDLIMPVCLLQEAKVAFEALLAFITLDLILHHGQITRHGDLLAIVEVDLVVGHTLNELDALTLEGGVKVGKGFMEELG